MRPLLFSCWWHAQFSRLAPVLEYSARVHCPDWDIRIEKLGRPQGLTSAMGVSAHEDNTHKLDRWRRVVDEAPDGTPILLIDTDTVILRPLDDVWKSSFDVAYTDKPAGSRFPLNGGVMFLRANLQSRAFVGRWADQNRTFLSDRSYKTSSVRRTFGGINQAALGSILRENERGGSRVSVLALSCAEWNCEDETWEKFGPQTRILHVKSGLRREILKLQGPRPKFAHRAAVDAWKRMASAVPQEGLAS